MSAFLAGAKPHLEAHEKVKQEVYLVADGQPLSRLEICNAALKNDLYFGSSITKFNGNQIDGKNYNTEKILNLCICIIEVRRKIVIKSN